MDNSRYMPDERRNAIRSKLLVSGVLRVEELAKELDVSLATVRRDLAILEDEGFVQRTHGGARVDTPRGADQAFSLREQTDQAAKRTIARAAIRLIRTERTLFLNDGSTMMALARELVTLDGQMTVATCGINIATTLSENPRIQTFLAGGVVRHRTVATTGGFVDQMLSVMHVDTAFIAAESIDARDGMTFSYEEDARIARRMSERASKTVALATARKLTTHDCFTAFGPDRIDVLITDCSDAALITPFEQAGIKVLVAQADTVSDSLKDANAA